MEGRLLFLFLMHFTRSSGLLCHISSLPSAFCIGDLGPEAYHFVDFLRQSGQSIWQILPIVPTGHGNSPYSSPSTFAGNTLFISPEKLVQDGLLREADLDPIRSVNGESNHSAGSSTQRKVDVEAVRTQKQALLSMAWRSYEKGLQRSLEGAFEAFKRHHASWLEDYVLFDAIKEVNTGSGWTQWRAGLRDRHPSDLEAFSLAHAEALEKRRFEQFLFGKQWNELRTYCSANGVQLFGDLPIYVAHDSADVWANPHLFELEADGSPIVVAGVPPDYFSETGQRWGNPIYRWEVMKSNGYAWWNARLNHILNQVDILRLDHFRGFEAFWVVPASEPTAVNGTWRKGPAEELFRVLEDARDRTKHPHGLPIVAEDLGVITPEVVQLMETFNYPGMAVLQFAFGSDWDNVFLPHHYKKDLVAYSGTHDNNTWMGWWSEPEGGATMESFEKTRSFCANYFHMPESPSEIDPQKLLWQAIETLLESEAHMVILPVQDLLELGKEGRMNIPGTSSGNWDWQLSTGQLNADIAVRLQRVSKATNRCA